MRIAGLSLALLSVLGGAPQASERRVEARLAEEVRSFVSNPVVVMSIREQNARYGDLSQADIDALDQQWRAEREAAEQPLIARTLSNPLSNYLTRIQAGSIGLYAAIFVMDRNGLNVGQSAITGDFWQGDEAKFLRTFALGPDAVFVDEPEAVEAFGIDVAQLNLTVVDPETGEPIGAVTVDVNLNEFARREAAGIGF